MSLIVDASVAVRWYLPEDGSAAAERILEREDDLIAPDLVLAEIANAVWKRVRKNEVTKDDALAIVERARIDFTEFVPIERLVVSAMALAADHNHPIYDCLYVALARREDALLVTADGRLAELAERVGVKVEAIA